MPRTTAPTHSIASERAINTHQVSELLGLATVTLQQLRVRGDGPPFFRVGRQVRYRLGDVLSYRDARTVARRDAEVAPMT